MSTGDSFTRDQVPVSLKIYLKWRSIDPVEVIPFCVFHTFDKDYLSSLSWFVEATTPPLRFLGTRPN